MELLGRFGSQPYEHTKYMLSPIAASQGFLARVSCPNSTLQHSSGLVPVSAGRVQGAPLLAVHKMSGQQCQVSFGSFPSLSPSCRHARGLLKNLFHSSRHGEGNDRQFAATSFILGLGDCFAHTVCRQFWGGAQELLSLEMEVRAWVGSHLPFPILFSVPTAPQYFMES